MRDKESKDLINAVVTLRRGYPGTPIERRDFSEGVVSRLKERVDELNRKATTPTTTTALVVVKDQMIKRHMEGLKLRTFNTRQRFSQTNQDAFQAGRRAGNGVDLGIKRRIGG